MKHIRNISKDYKLRQGFNLFLTFANFGAGAICNTICKQYGINALVKLSYASFGFATWSAVEYDVCRRRHEKEESR